MAALAIDKAGPRPCHFRSGPNSGPTTRPGSQKSKIFVVHRLAILKCHPERLKCGKALWQRPGLLQCSPIPLGGGLPLPKSPTSLSALQFSNLGPSGNRASLLASPNPFTEIRLCSEMNLFYPLIIPPYIMLYYNTPCPEKRPP